MEMKYKGRSIFSFTRKQSNSSFVVAYASVYWVSGEKLEGNIITGPADQFTNAAEAEAYAIELAKTWIDDGKPER